MSKKIPYYKQIREDLLQKIENGYYAEGEIIPTELELAEIYQVSRPTIRQAISTLVSEGFLERKKRKGTVVRKRKIYQDFTHVIESFDSEMMRKGLIPKTKVITYKKEVASHDVANSLEINEGDDVYKLIRLRYAKDEPIVLVTTYIPTNQFPDLLNVDFEKESLYQSYADRKKPIGSIVRRLDVLKADETTSDMLNIAEGDPIFYFHSYGYTDDRVPIEYSISKYRGDINSFVFEISNFHHII